MAETGSTNADVLALARDGAPEGIVLVADHQHSGRGRRGRRWVAPPGASLLVSVLLRPPAPLAGGMAMAVAVALAEAVEQVTGCSPGLKWPNDLVVGERKLAGILAEADWPPGVTASGGWRPPSPHDRLAVVVGAGLNVNWPGARPPAAGPGDASGLAAAEGSVASGGSWAGPGAGGGDAEGSVVPGGSWAGGSAGGGDAEGSVASGGPWAGPGAGGGDAEGSVASGGSWAGGGVGGDEAVPADVADVAVALNHLVGRQVDRVELLARFLRQLDGHHGRLVAERSAAPLLDLWRDRSATLGCRVRVDLGTSDVEGTAVDVTAEGHLVVEAAGGEHRTLAVGDVVHLRPA